MGFVLACDASELKTSFHCIAIFGSTYHWFQVISFLDHFNKLQVVLGRMRAHEDGRRLTSTGQCGARIDLGKNALFCNKCFKHPTICMMGFPPHPVVGTVLLCPGLIIS